MNIGFLILKNNFEDIKKINPQADIREMRTLTQGANKVMKGYFKDNSLVAYLIYWVFKDKIEIKQIFVAPSFRRQGIGTELISKVFINDKIVQRSLTIDVPDNCLDMHLFLKGLGFTATVKDCETYSFNFTPQECNT